MVNALPGCLGVLEMVTYPVCQGAREMAYALLSVRVYFLKLIHP